MCNSTTVLLGFGTGTTGVHSTLDSHHPNSNGRYRQEKHDPTNSSSYCNSRSNNWSPEIRAAEINFTAPQTGMTSREPWLLVRLRRKHCFEGQLLSGGQQMVSHLLMYEHIFVILFCLCSFHFCWPPKNEEGQWSILLPILPLCSRFQQRASPEKILGRSRIASQPCLAPQFSEPSWER